MNRKKLINNNGTALFMALMILSGVLIVSLGAASLVMSGIKQGRTQTYSTKAYFAAEAGAERILWEIRKNGFDEAAAGCSAGYYVNFTAASCELTYTPANHNNPLSNNSFYTVIYKDSAPTYKSIGAFSDVKRSVEISY